MAMINTPAMMASGKGQSAIGGDCGVVAAMIVYDGVLLDRWIDDGWWWLVDKECDDVAITVTLSWGDRDFVTDHILSVGVFHRRLHV
jgi:hypothetical protein